MNERDGFLRNIVHYCSLNGEKGMAMLREIFWKHSDAVKMLLNHRDTSGNSPLVYAFCTRAFDLIQWLLSHGAQPDTQFECRYFFLNFKIIPKILQATIHSTSHSLEATSSIEDDTYHIDQHFSLFEEQLMLTDHDTKLFRRLVRRFGTHFDHENDHHGDGHHGHHGRDGDGRDGVSEEKKKRNTQRESKRRLGRQRVQKIMNQFLRFLGSKTTILLEAVRANGGTSSTIVGAQSITEHCSSIRWHYSLDHRYLK